MMAATLAEGDTVIENAAQEPEIIDLANFLNRCGAKISGAGTQTVSVSGVRSLKAVDYKVIPDRIEAGTLMAAAAITRGDVTVKNIIPEHMTSLTVKLQEAGVDVIYSGTSARIIVPDGLKAVNIKTMPYPGFPTDMQPQLAALLSLSRGTSVITESIFENRFMHVQELKRMGADIQIEGHSIIIEGVAKLSGAPVRTSDLRAGAALAIAALAAEGETLIDDTDRFIDRGYEKLVHKLSGLGGDVKEVK
jgi:UDP-N-acetylglucosamine 1-carboxyvinyltransferase